MKSKFLSTASAIVFFHLTVSGSAVAAGDGLTVDVAGVQVVSKVYPPIDPKEENPFSIDAVAPFNETAPGVSIAIMVSAPQGGILNIDTTASKLANFADDKGTILFSSKSSFGNPGFGTFPKASKDGKVGLVMVEGKIAPAAGAIKVSAKGSLAVQVGSKKTNHNLPGVSLKKGTVIKAGAVEFTVSGSDSEGNGLSVTLNTKTELATIAGIKFLDPKGQEIQSQRTMTSTSWFGTKQASVTYELGTKLGQVQMEIEIWDDLKTVHVPFDLSVPIGLATK